MEKLQQHPAGKQPARSRAVRLLILVAIGLLVCLVARSAISLALWLITSITAGTPPPGSFWSDIFPAIVLAAIVVIGSLGVYWFLRLFRN